MEENSSRTAPSSTDACNSIVHALMCRRQGGESETFSKRAIESLVKKLKEKGPELDALITAITTNGAHSTMCVTIPRTLDGRLQIAGRKCFPHVIYARIWRWSDLHKNELRRTDDCQFSYDMKVDSVCVNPYHYIRDVSLGVDLAALTLHHAQQQAMYNAHEGGGDCSRQDWNSSQGYPSSQPPGYYYNNYNLPPSYPQPSHGGPPQVSQMPHEVVYGHQHPPGWHHQVTQKSTLEYGKPAAQDNSKGPIDSGESRFINPSPERKPEYNNRLTLEESTTATQSSSSKIELSLLDDCSEPPVSRSALPEHWCSITYHELDSPVGESFKAPTKGCPNVQIDGYLEQNDPTRFCLGALNNVQSSKCVETVTKVKLHIGKGILLEKFGEGDVHLTNQSEYPVYIKSHFLDWNARTKRKAEIFQEMKMGSDLVHKIPGKGGTIRIFRLRECSILMRQQVQVSQGLDNGSSNVPNGGHLAPALSHANAASGIGIDDLRKWCSFSLSFIKGFGPDYLPQRRNITDCPCWIQVQLHRGLQVLDEILIQSKRLLDAQNQQSKGAAATSAPVPNAITPQQETSTMARDPGLLALCS